MRILSIIFSFFLFLNCHAQNEQLETIEISLLSVEVGDQLYETFGHTAIRVHDVSTRRSQVYNYGTFDYKTENFYLKFLRGKLPYRLAIETYEGFLRENNFLKRTVWEQRLDLTNDEKKVVLDYLSANMHPDRREYNYDFFFDNCSTRAIDVFKTIGFEQDGNVQDITLREMLKTNLNGKTFESFGIDLIIGSVADKKATLREQYFLPMFLHDYVNEMRKGDKAVVVSDNIVLNFEEDVNQRKKPTPNFPYYLGFFFLIIRFILAGSTKGAKIYDYIILTIGSLAAIIMLFMWFGTDHLSTKDNWNLLWATPLFIPFMFAGKSIKRVLAIPILIGLVVSIANAYTQFSPQFFNMAIVPLCILFGWSVIKRSWSILEDLL